VPGQGDAQTVSPAGLGPLPPRQLGTTALGATDLSRLNRLDTAGYRSFGAMDLKRTDSKAAGKMLPLDKTF